MMKPSLKFYIELINIINFHFSLGERILYSKVVTKILKFLVERFRPKVINIEESKNLLSVGKLVTLPSHKISSIL